MLLISSWLKAPDTEEMLDDANVIKIKQTTDSIGFLMETIILQDKTQKVTN
jgi:hypothetical protein